VLLACFAFLLITIVNLLITIKNGSSGLSYFLDLSWKDPSGWAMSVICHEEPYFWFCLACTFPGRILLGRQCQLNVMRNFPCGMMVVEELSLWHDGG